MILFDEERKVFRLDAGNSSYAFYITPSGRLRHLYWGPSMDTTDLLDLGGGTLNVEPPFDPEENQNGRGSQLWEFGPNDLGTKAPASAIVRNADGNTATDPRYVSHRIIAGKPRLPGLPSTFLNSDDEAETLEITLVDQPTKVEFLLRYTAFRDLPVIARSAVVTNKGDAPVDLQKIMSLTTSFRHEDLDVIYFDGFWAKERQYHRERLQGGMRVLGADSGYSSHTMNSCVVLCDPKTTEEFGRAYGVLFVYSGKFAVEVEQAPLYRTTLNLGIHPVGFSWYLEPGESFQSPEALQAVSDNGLGALSRSWHDLIRQHIINPKWRTAKRPILCNNWEAMHFQFSKEKLMELGKTAKANGIEMLVLDDGWFGKRDNERCALGDWYANTEKIGGTMGELAEAVRSLGLKFGLWFEPEMVSGDSDLYRAHPDWAIQVPNRRSTYQRFQFMLDFSRKEVVDHVYETISAVIEEAKLDYMKWDANREMTEVGSLAFPPERQGEIAHRFILGVYDLYERITKRFPNMLIEGCSAGGGRFDAGILYYSPQIWTSDNSDAFDRLAIQYGTSFAYPCSTMGAHVARNWFPQRYSPVETRAAVAFSGTFGYELDLNQMPPEELAQVKGQCEFYHKHHHIVEQGDYYRLANPFEEKTVAWMHVTKDKSEFLLTVVFTRWDHAYEGQTLRLPGLDLNATYTDGEHTWTGKRLAHAGIEISHSSFRSDMFSIVIHGKRV
ncbi:MAG: alpha-galactosidase [Lentisphaeria bacterium]|nr:alpha-galactosidase [Lentisphaeria bacterium]